MIGHIVKREFFDHLNSLRFALTALIMAALMITNAVVHLQSHPDKVRRYSEKVTTDQNKLQSQTDLYQLLKKGPGRLYKRPSALTFIADGGDAFLPGSGTINWESWSRTAGLQRRSKKHLVAGLSDCQPECAGSTSSGGKDRLGIYHHLSALFHPASVYV